jgi:RHS repeat-associated protein
LDLDFAKPDMSQATTQALTVDATSNRLLGFSQRVTTHQAGKADAVMSANVNYSVDENGAMTSDGLRTFEYDAANRMDKVRLMKGGEAASVTYLHNGLGQRVFKSEVTADQKLPRAKTLGAGFVAWLKANFQWMYAQAQADASVGAAYSYADGQLPKWALLGEYDNGSANGTGRTEYVWLPTDSGAMPIGLYRGGKFYAIHADLLGTPRVMTSETNTPMWQWPYSAFGSNRPTGVLQATAKPKLAITNQPVLLKATAAPELNLGIAGWYGDEETGTFYNTLRDAIDPITGRYRQPDPSGLDGGANRFLYGNGNPLMFTDPEGLMGRPSGRTLGSGQPVNVSVGAGGLGNLGPFNFGADSGFSFDASPNMCFYVNRCSGAGWNTPVGGSIGGVVTVSSGALSTSTSEVCGGYVGNNQLLGNTSGMQYGRTIIGPSTGTGAGQLQCETRYYCVR